MTTTTTPIPGLGWTFEVRMGTAPVGTYTREGAKGRRTWAWTAPTGETGVEASELRAVTALVALAGTR